jgi:hypothetical protein
VDRAAFLRREPRETTPGRKQGQGSQGRETMSSSRDELLDILIAKDAIRDVLFSYSRAADRKDLAKLTAIFWPDSHCDFGGYFSGSGPEFAAWAVAAGNNMIRTMHFVGASDISVDGEVADSETYAVTYHEMMQDGQPMTLVVGGRYLDRLERRNGEWRIAERKLATEWTQSAVKPGS